MDLIVKEKKLLRIAFRDVAFQFRMGAGFAGDVNRTHPAEIEPALINTSNPPTFYGQPALIATAGTANSVRMIISTDASTVPVLPYGIFARPFPTQQAQASVNYAPASLGAATPPTSGVIDILRAGLIIGQMNPAAGAVIKGGTVYVWAAATSGAGATLHTQGGYESVASGGNTIQLEGRYYFNGPADSSGVVEISANV